MSTAGVYDFGAIGERMKELGIAPVYGAAPQKSTVATCEPDSGARCFAVCDLATNCRVRAMRGAHPTQSKRIRMEQEREAREGAQK